MNWTKIVITFLVVAGVVVILLVWRPWEKNRNSSNLETNTVNTESNTENKNTNIREPKILLDNAYEQYNGGLPVPPSIPVAVLPKNSKNIPGGAGFMWEDDNTIMLVLVDKDLQATRGTCDGGGVKDPDAIPTAKGDWNDWMPDDMKKETIDAGVCWTVRGIKPADIKKYYLGYCIFIGYSIRGNWDKYYNDQHQRGKLGKVPGSFDNNGGGMNGWALNPFYKKAEK